MDSFVSTIYRAHPFRETTSEALPIPGQLKRAVFRWEQNKSPAKEVKLPREDIPGWLVHGTTGDSA